MILTSDYHTHTVYSHGKGTILDNALIAKEKGLVELGITDHGFAHSVFGINKKKLPQMRKDCQLASEKTGVKVLLGVESNIVSTNGKTDLNEKYYDDFDIYLAGIHKIVLYSLNTIFPLAIPNLTASNFNKKQVSKSLIKNNTKTFINTIKNTS